MKDSDKARANEQQRHFSLQDHGDEKTDHGDRPLQPVLHSELRQPVAGMENEGDDGGADSVKHGRHGGKIAQMDIERTQSGDDDEIGKDEGPATSPRAPKPGAQVGDVDTDLDGEGSWERLTYRNGLPHLLLGQPFSVGDKLSLHLADECDGTAEPKQPQPQEIGYHLANSAS